MEFHNWKPEEVTNLYTRLIAAENRLLHIEGKLGKDGTTDLDKMLQKHEDWLILIDKAIKELRQLTEEQEEYLQKLIGQLEKGGIPKQTAKTTLAELKKTYKTEGTNPLKLLAIIQKNVSAKFLDTHYIEESDIYDNREVILSEYLVGE